MTYKQQTTNTEKISQCKLK